MHLLVIAAATPSRDDICDFTSLWNWYVVDELRHAGVEVSFAAPVRSPPLSERQINGYFQDLSLDGIDHIVAFGHRYFERIPEDCVKVLRRRCRGLVMQVHEKQRTDKLVDWTFTMTSVKPRYASHNRCVGWAADPEMLWSEQDPAELRVFVDHPDRHHDGTRPDITAKVLRSCLEFADSGIWQRWGYKSIRLRRLLADSIEDFSTDEVPDYLTAGGVPFAAVCEEHRRSQLFLATHRDTCGFSGIESAMAGGLPVVPFKFIPQDRLVTIRHVVYPANAGVPWAAALDVIDPQASQARARRNDWPALVWQMLPVFTGAKGRT